jgi:hypothetical protein
LSPFIKIKNRSNGGIIRIDLVYGDCKTLVQHKTKGLCNDLHTKGSMNFYIYQPIYIPGTNYYVHRTIYNPDRNERAVRNSSGLRLIFRISGQQSKFAFPRLLSSIVSGYILLIIATFIVDSIVIYLIPGKKLYKSAKYETTENFNDLRHNLVMENNLRKQIATVTKVARFKHVSHVEKLLNELKTNVQIKDYDQLVLAVIEVFGLELKDMTNANEFIEKLSNEDSKITANILIGQLKESYLIAAKVGSIERIQQIRNEAIKEDNERIKQMCDQYLSQNGKQQNANIELRIQ